METAPYNSAFFNLYTTTFLTLKKELSQEKSLELLTKIFSTNLKSAYDQSSWQRGSPNDFAKVVGARDQAVGLKVSFPTLEEDQIIYQFHTDPFPNLKNQVEPEIFDRTYLQFKIDYLLGDGWNYQTTKHFWKGDSYTEHLIFKIQ